jgi:hypothetical protein
MNNLSVHLLNSKTKYGMTIIILYIIRLPVFSKRRKVSETGDMGSLSRVDVA